MLDVKHRRFSPSPWLALPAAMLLAALLASCQSKPVPQPAGNQVAGNQPANAVPPVAEPPVAKAPAVPVPPSPEPSAAKAPDAPKEEVAPVRVRAEGQLGPGKNTLFIDIAPPEGAKLTLESPLSVRGSGGIGLDFPRRLGGTLSSHPMPLRLPIDVADGATGPARLELTYYWCTEGNEASCSRERAHLDVELDLTGSAAGGEAHLSYRAHSQS
jgi:hypothetical protein